MFVASAVWNLYVYMHVRLECLCEFVSVSEQKVGFDLSCYAGLRSSEATRGTKTLVFYAKTLLS